MEKTITNGLLNITITDRGAELKSIKHLRSKREILWQADPNYWPRHAPVLFPVVGKLTRDDYQYKGNKYAIHQHGFARDLNFKLKEETENSLRFRLRWSKDTIEYYPFRFRLDIIYTLTDNRIDIEYEVCNSDAETMYFSIGAHPGFNCPMYSKEKFEDYSIEFEKEETAIRYLIENGLQSGETESLIIKRKKLKLERSLFEKDAVILKNLNSSFIKLRSPKNPLTIKMDISQFPFLGIWTRSDAPFICLEPWHGITDTVNGTEDISKKEGIIELKKHKVFKCAFSITIEDKKAKE